MMLRVSGSQEAAARRAVGILDKESELHDVLSFMSTVSATATKAEGLFSSARRILPYFITNIREEAQEAKVLLGVNHELLNALPEGAGAASPALSHQELSDDLLELEEAEDEDEPPPRPAKAAASAGGKKGAKSAARPAAAPRPGGPAVAAASKATTLAQRSDEGGREIRQEVNGPNLTSESCLSGHGGARRQGFHYKQHRRHQLDAKLSKRTHLRCTPGACSSEGALGATAASLGLKSRASRRLEPIDCATTLTGRIPGLSAPRAAPDVRVPASRKVQRAGARRAPRGGRGADPQLRGVTTSPGDAVRTWPAR